MIFFADDTPAGLYCIHSGNVKIYKVGHDGKEQIVRLVGAGDVLGYRSLIAGTRYASYAMSIEPTQICLIPRSEFLNMLSSNGEFSLRMMSLLSSELRVAEERIVELAQKPVRERLAETLLLLERKYGLESDNATLNIKLTREEFANIVGTATETVIRLLSDLKKEGLIDLPGRRIQILNRRALIDCANVED